MSPADGHTGLTARSECYLKLGDHKKAYDDAELSLEEDANFIKGIHAKAEALYVKGSFEYALVFYHRGHTLRPELDEFTLGISKVRSWACVGVAWAALCLRGRSGVAVALWCGWSWCSRPTLRVLPLQIGAHFVGRRSCTRH